MTESLEISTAKSLFQITASSNCKISGPIDENPSKYLGSAPFLMPRQALMYIPCTWPIRVGPRIIHPFPYKVYSWPCSVLQPTNTQTNFLSLSFRPYHNGTNVFQTSHFVVIITCSHTMMKCICSAFNLIMCEIPSSGEGGSYVGDQEAFVN